MRRVQNNIDGHPGAQGAGGRPPPLTGGRRLQWRPRDGRGHLHRGRADREAVPLEGAGNLRAVDPRQRPRLLHGARGDRHRTIFLISPRAQEVDRHADGEERLAGPRGAVQKTMSFSRIERTYVSCPWSGTAFDRLPSMQIAPAVSRSPLEPPPAGKRRRTASSSLRTWMSINILWTLQRKFAQTESF